MENPAIRTESGIRNEDGTFKPGFSGNPSGRPKNTMKDYMRQKFMKMSDEEKEKFLEEVQHVDQIKLAEGNPDTNNSLSGKDGEPLPILVQFINGKPTDNQHTD